MFFILFFSLNINDIFTFLDELMMNIVKEKDEKIKELNLEMLKKDKIHFQNTQNIKNEYDDYIFKLTNEKGRNYGIDFYKQMYMQQKIQHEKEINELNLKLNQK